MNIPVSKKYAEIYRQSCEESDITNLSGEIAVLRTLCVQYSREVVERLQDGLDNGEAISLGFMSEALDRLTNMIEKISKVAERMRKIQDGISVNITADFPLIETVIRQVVLPNVSSLEDRMRMLHDLEKFMKNHGAVMMGVPEKELPAIMPPKDKIFGGKMNIGSAQRDFNRAQLKAIMEIKGIL